MTDNEKVNAYIWAAKMAPDAVPLMHLDKGDEFVWARTPGPPKLYRGRGWYRINDRDGGTGSIGRASVKTAVIKLRATGAQVLQMSIDEIVTAISQQGCDITTAITRLNAAYLALYGLTANQINHGDCEAYAGHLEQIYKAEAIGYWGNELTDVGEDDAPYEYHHIVKYRDKYYDSAHPQGVTNFRDIWSK